MDRPESDTESDFLHRVALAFDADDEDKTRLSSELTAWLDGRSEDDVTVLVPHNQLSL